MLAELYSLKQSLDRAGLGIPLDHRDFETPAGRVDHKMLLIRIDDEGRIAELRLPLEGEMPGFWTLKNYNSKYFPATRPDNPLFTIAPEDPRRALLFKQASAKVCKGQEWAQSVQSIAAENDVQMNKQDLQHLAKEQADRLLLWTAGNPKHLARLRAFALAFKKFSRNPDITANSLFEAALKQVKNDPTSELLTALTHLMVGQKKEKKNKDPVIEFKVQIIFDYSDATSLSSTLHEREVHQTVLMSLIAEASASQIPRKSILPNRGTISASACSFQSSASQMLTTPFGAFSIKRVINMEKPPYAKKGGTDVPCNNRYYKSGAEGFVIGLELSRELVAAMKAVTSPENENKTWRSIRNGKVERDERTKKSKELYDAIIAFPNFPATGEAAVAPFARPRSDDDEFTESEIQAKVNKRRKSAYQQASEPVCQAFEEKLARFPNAILNILLVRQISPGQIQLAYGSKLSIKQFLESVRRWQSTEGNLPPSLKIPVPFKGVEGFRSLSPGLLFPEEVCSLLTHLWIRDGTHSARLNAPPVGVVLDIFLHRLNPQEERTAVEQLLELTLKRSEALIIHGGGTLRKDASGSLGLWQKFSAPAGISNDPRWTLLRTVSLIGTFLSLLNSTYHTYMNQHAYLTGFLLACADELHKQYHLANSDGKLPSTLIGNGLLIRAAEAPAAALAELLERSRIYIGWAKVAKQQMGNEALKVDKTPEGREKKSKFYAPSNARFALEKMEETADKLKDVFPADSEPKELTVTEKAQMFLGYLTPLPKRFKTTTDEDGVDQDEDSTSAENK